MQREKNIFKDRITFLIKNGSKFRRKHCIVYRFVQPHTHLIIKNDKCQNPNFKSNLNYQMPKILIGVRHFEI